MKELEQGNIELLAYQTSIGGSILLHDRAIQDDADEDEPLLELSRKKDDEEIVIPELWEITAPLPAGTPSFSIPQVDASYVEEVRRIESRSEQPRAPPAVPCRSNRCNHKVIFGNHFDKDAWQEYVEEDDRHTRQQRENEEQEEEDNDFL